jgi:hypothetical protein
MSWRDKLVETSAEGTGHPIKAASYTIAGWERAKFLVEGAIGGHHRESGHPVFLCGLKGGSQYITTDEALAMGMALIKVATTEIRRQNDGEG